MQNLNVGSFLILNANRYPEKTALIFENIHLSYRELNLSVNRLANSLIDLGIVKGDKVGYIFKNSIEIVEIYFAVQKTGAVAVPLNHRVTAEEAEYMVNLSECRVLIYADIFKNTIDAIKDKLVTVEFLVCHGKKSRGEYSFEQLIRTGKETEPAVDVSSDDLSRIQFTGGTTGRPKGVMRTHGADVMLTVSIMSSNKLGANPDEVVLIHSPLNHQAGISWMLPALCIGTNLVICDAMNPAEILSMIQKLKVTFILILPPSTYLRLFDFERIKDYDLTSVKHVSMSAGGTSAEIVLKAYDTFANGEVYFGWGGTEIGAGTIGVITKDMAFYNPDRIHSIGRPMPFVEVRIIDDNGNDVDPGGAGECIVRSPTVMSGYYNDPQMTGEVIRNGWVSTGDIFEKDKDGYYYLVDRKKDMIKTGGENVFAQEVENVLRENPAIENCAVFGVPDERFGEIVMAAVKLREGFKTSGDEILELCRNRLSCYKNPKQIEFVDSFPVDSAGKIQKFKLREKYKK